MLNCRLVVDVGSDFDSLNFAPFRLPYYNLPLYYLIELLDREAKLTAVTI